MIRKTKLSHCQCGTVKLTTTTIALSKHSCTSGVGKYLACTEREWWVCQKCNPHPKCTLFPFEKHGNVSEGAHAYCTFCSLWCNTIQVLHAALLLLMVQPLPLPSCPCLWQALLTGPQQLPLHLHLHLHFLHRLQDLHLNLHHHLL